MQLQPKLVEVVLALRDASLLARAHDRGQQ
jgi:hypothetical protein